VTLLLEQLQWYHADGNVFLQWILVGNETWCHNVEPTEKPAGI
jgi:hypothetical protein